MTEFHERLFNYRYYELQMKSKEAAALLGLTPAHYSHYEKGRNKFPAELLKQLKDNFGMSDDKFLEILLGRPSKRQSPKEISERSREIQNAYLVTFAENYFPLIQEPEIRQMLSIIHHSSPEVRSQQIKEISDVLNKSKTFSLSKKNSGENQHQATSPSISYKLNKKQTFMLVDGSSLSKSFLKTDDFSDDEE